MFILFDIFDRVFGQVKSLRMWYNETPMTDALREQGFSLEEADQLTWFYNHRATGRTIGFIAGVTVAYTITPWIKIIARTYPRLGHNSGLQMAARLGAGFLTLQWVDYFFTVKRRGANIGSLNTLQWNNNLYSFNKENFIQNFEVLNRPFTQEERIQFSNNQFTKNSPFARRFSYNPTLHGDDEEKFLKNIDDQFVQKTPPWERRDVQQQIAVDNKAKIDAGETVRVRPFNLLQHVDKVGLKHGLKPNNLLTNWFPLT